MNTNIDDDFKKAVEEINAKVKEAALALKTANELAKRAGIEGLVSTDLTMNRFYYRHKEICGGAIDDEMDKLAEKYDLIKVGELMREIGNAGWSTSSMSC